MSEPVAAEHAESRPRVFDTYALVYSFILAFLVPGAISIARLPFRTYTFAYVAPITLAFVFGLAATFLTDSRDGAKAIALRFAVLTPIVLITGTAVLFTAALGVVPISDYIKPQYFDTTKWIAAALLLLLAAPLVVALVHTAPPTLRLAACRAAARDRVRGRGGGSGGVPEPAARSRARHDVSQGRDDLRGRGAGVVSALVRACRWRLARRRPGVRPRSPESR